MEIYTFFFIIICMIFLTVNSTRSQDVVYGENYYKVCSSWTVVRLNTAIVINNKCTVEKLNKNISN